jgi:hypothetical protein
VYHFVYHAVLEIPGKSFVLLASPAGFEPALSP